jgi:chromosome segregation ATPase
MSVSPATAKALREAMARLMEGKPRHTDGAFIKENLYKEAQVSRATMNRATEVMAEWDAYAAQHGRRTKGEAARDAELQELTRKLKATTAECTQLRKKLDAAATVIAALHHDNQALREHIDSRYGKVVDLDGRRS